MLSLKLVNSVENVSHPSLQDYPMQFSYLFVLAEEAGAPAALTTGPRVHALPSRQDLVAGGGVIAPGELSSAVHIGIQHCRVVLNGRERGRVGGEERGEREGWEERRRGGEEWGERGEGEREKGERGGREKETSLKRRREGRKRDRGRGGVSSLSSTHPQLRRPGTEAVKTFSLSFGSSPSCTHHCPPQRWRQRRSEWAGHCSSPRGSCK